MPDLLGRGRWSLYKKPRGRRCVSPAPRALLGEWRKANYSVKEA